ncbi:MAG: diguanylate cyclase [bacterium]|nr:diguanylate cyclase [bacterium]
MILAKLRKIKFKKKVMLILLATWFLLGALDVFIQRAIMFPRFKTLEYSEARKDLKRCVHAMEREIHHLDSLLYDWSAWDDTCEFVRDRTPKYINANLSSATFTNSNINTICIIDTNGKVVWGRLYDKDKKNYITIDTIPFSPLSGFSPILNHYTLDSTYSGIMRSEDELYLVASRPIITPNEAGAIQGTILMARILDENVVETISRQTRVNFKAIPLHKISNPGIEAGLTRKELKGLLDQIKNESTYLIKAKDSKNLDAYTLYPNIKGKPAFLARATVPSHITEKGNASIHYAFLSTVTAAFVVLLVILYLIQHAILTPISVLIQHIHSIGTTGDLGSLVSLDRRDEIGILANEFNKMLGQLNNQNIELEKMGVELIDDIVRQQEVETKLKEEIDERVRLANQKEELLQELNKKNKILENLAITDSLTGLYNHKYIIERLRNEISEAKRYKKNLSIVMMDIDYFKKVNDTYGHQVGDDVLVGVSTAITDNLREVDLAGRYGGEEFMLILNVTNLEGAKIVAQRIRKAIQNLTWDIEELNVTISAGLACLKDENASALIEKADALLYKAKKNGRNRLEI